MQFGILGVDYQRADLNIRDYISFTDQKKMDFFHLAEEKGMEQVMILSTCNRSEVYYCFESETQKEQMKALYKSMFPDLNLDVYLREMEGEEAYSYLFRVTAGLESMVLGEDQILGQVKNAIDFSRTMGHSKKELNKIVRDAITCAKKIKTKFHISEKPLSVGYIGIQEAKKACGIKGKTVLIIGSGNTAVLALRYLNEEQAGEIFLCSRTLAHAGKIQKQFPNIKIILYEQRYNTICQCDLVVSATASPHLVVKKENVNLSHPTVFLDLATPRDIDQTLDQYPQATLINLDNLQKISRENLKERERLCKESSQLIEEFKRETLEWLKVSRMDETIQSLQERCQEIAQDSYHYLSQKMDLEDREKKLLKKVLNASLQRMIREPIQELKQLDTKEKQDTYKRIVHQLFQI